MEAVLDIPATVAKPSRLRSATTNGNRAFVQGGDGRGVWVRRWKDLTDMHVADLGGQEAITAAQFSLCQRAATLEVQIEQLEAAMSSGEDVDLDLFGRLAGHLRRYHQTLGLERRARPVDQPLTLTAISGHIKASRPSGGQE